MKDELLLKKVKIALGITGTYQDETLKVYIDEVKEYLRDAGVAESIIHNKVSAGVITRGVADLWNYGAGNTDLSPYFMKRASQLSLKEEVDSGI